MAIYFGNCLLSVKPLSLKKHRSSQPVNAWFASAAFSCFDHPENQNRSEKIGRGNLSCLGNHNHWPRGMPFISACFTALDISCTGKKQESQTLRIRPEDVWVVVEVAGGSTVAWSSSGRTSVTPLLLSRGSPFSRASRLLPSTAPNASRFRPSSKSATHMSKKQLYMYWDDMNTDTDTDNHSSSSTTMNETKPVTLFLMVVKLFHLERYLLSEEGKLSEGPQEDGNAASSSSDGLGRCTTALELHLRGHRRKKNELWSSALINVNINKWPFFFFFVFLNWSIIISIFWITLIYQSSLTIYLHSGVSSPSRCNSWTGPHQSESRGKAWGYCAQHTNERCNCGTAPWHLYNTALPAWNVKGGQMADQITQITKD